jgi:regulator of sirC expression with transglutaminase-like and TPR domain
MIKIYLMTIGEPSQVFNQKREHSMLNKEQKRWLEQVSSVYLQYEQYHKAQPLLVLLLQLYPQAIRPVKQLAYLYYQQDNFEMALQYCERYHNTEVEDTNKAAIYLLESYCHLKLGNSDKAKYCYQQFTEERALS